MKRYAAVVLAGGLSSRMQSFKPLLRVGGKTITDRLIDTFRQNGVEVILVAGYRQDELRSGIQSRNVRIVENPDYSRGMFSSIQTGLRSLEPDYQAVFINPVDIPLIRPFTIRRLLEVAEEYPGRLIYPVFNNTRGHPPLIPAAIVRSILACQADANLKSILDVWEDAALKVPVPDSCISFDIDHPADYEALLERFRHYEVPTDEECTAIIQDICKLGPQLLRHCARVAEVADAISEALALSGVNVDIEAVHAGAALHDIAKGQANHEQVGASILREMGFGKVAEIVKAHTDLPEDNRSIPLETKVVYLSDKFVIGGTIVPIAERYQSAIQKFGTTDDIKAGILARMDRALNVKKEIERLINHSLEELFS